MFKVSGKVQGSWGGKRVYFLRQRGTLSKILRVSGLLRGPVSQEGQQALGLSFGFSFVLGETRLVCAGRRRGLGQKSNVLTSI